MAEPTLKDVLHAIAEIRREMATKSDLARVEAKVDGLRTEMEERFDDLDDELAKHSERTHRKLEARIERLEKRTPAKKVSAARPLRRR